MESERCHSTPSTCDKLVSFTAVEGSASYTKYWYHKTNTNKESVKTIATLSFGPARKKCTGIRTRATLVQSPTKPIRLSGCICDKKIKLLQSYR